MRANSPDAPTLVSEQRRAILRSGSYNFVVPDGPPCHQSRRDVINRRAGQILLHLSRLFGAGVSAANVAVVRGAYCDAKLLLVTPLI